MKQTNKQIHKYFRIGDIVRNEDIWGKKLFVVDGFGGNAYLPELYVHSWGQDKRISNSCNWSVIDTKLISALHRPLRKMKKEVLIKLLRKGNEEAKREIIMRTHKS